MPKGVYPRPSFLERFWNRVDKFGPDAYAGEIFIGLCWIWLGKLDEDGYGIFPDRRSKDKTVNIRAHRLSYELEFGPIPEDLEPDHLCRNPGCVNPFHIEVVTGKVNILRGMNPPALNARKTHCKNGHALAEGNIFTPRGTTKRKCLTCKRAINRQVMQRKYIKHLGWNDLEFAS